MNGAIDPISIQARRALLDALDAIWDHRAAIILVGAQTMYLHTGDADLAINPDGLKPGPKHAEALE